MLNQWNESAVLKLQRAAHYIEDRILQPIELLEILFQNSNTERTALFPVRIAGFLEAMEGVVQVDFVGSPEKGYHPYADHSPMDQMNMKRENRMGLYRSRISSISDPDYKTGDVHETVIMTVSLSGPGGEDMGKLDIQMRFDYLLKDILQLGWWQSDLACIVDQKGKYMAHTNMIMNKRKFLGDKNDSLERAILEKMKQEPFGTVNSREHPPKKIAGFYKLEQVPWTIILFAQGDKIFQPIVNYRNAVALGSFVLVLLILILIRLHVGRMVTYIKLLSDKAQKVAKGEYGTPIPVDSEDEIGQLIHCHNTMVAGLAERDFIRNSFGRYVDPEF
ncbi:MAG: HAMP domain-containing protein, partial [Desulfobacula sp.]|nr:HAMP domain-containing protein [Desulfobacula sp.]